MNNRRGLIKQNESVAGPVVPQRYVSPASQREKCRVRKYQQLLIQLASLQEFGGDPGLMANLREELAERWKELTPEHQELMDELSKDLGETCRMAAAEVYQSRQAIQSAIQTLDKVAKLGYSAHDAHKQEAIYKALRHLQSVQKDEI